VAQNTEWISSSAAPALGPTTIRNFLLWRSTGISTNGCFILGDMNQLTLEDGQILAVGNAIFAPAAVIVVSEMLMRRVVIAGLTTDGANETAINLRPNVASSFIQIRCEDCDFGVATGVYAANATADINIATTLPVTQITAVNCRLGSATEVAGVTNMAPGSFIALGQKDQAVAHEVQTPIGTLSYDAVVTSGGNPTLRMTPSSATLKLRSNARQTDKWLIAVQSGQTIDFEILVQKDATYNGTQPRLVALSNPALDINADTIIATMSGGAGSFQALIGSIGPVPATGVIEIFADCDGTAGFINVADFTAIP
jgi:putative intracellular protease/amidase